MASRCLADTILRHRGGVTNNNLLDILEKCEDIDTTIYHASESPYIDIHNTTAYLKKYQNHFTLLNLNIQSLSSKFDLLVTFLEELSSSNLFFSAISLQETWLSEHHDVNNFLIPNYNIVSLDATCSSHGGLITYVHKSFHIKQLDLYKKTITWEGLFLEITGGGIQRPITLCNIYRPPRERNHDIESFLTDISGTLNTLSSKNSVLYAGDINIDLLKVDTRNVFASYLELLYSLSYLPCITLPTRLSRRSASLIDHVFYKSALPNESVNSGIIISSISDHFMTFTSLNQKILHEPPPKTITYQVSDNTSINEFVKAIEAENILHKLNKNISDDPTPNCNIIQSVISKNIDKYLPKKTAKFNKYKHKLHPWITIGLIKSIKNRDNIYKHLNSLDPDCLEYMSCKINFATYSKILKKSIRNAKISYYNNLFLKYHNDSKKSWGLINSLLNFTKNKKDISKLFTVGNQTITSEEEIAKHFNLFFSTIGEKQAAQIHNNTRLTFSAFLHSPTIKSFNFTYVSFEDVSKIMNNFKPKCSVGEDNISLKLIKKITNSLSPALSLVINQSFSTGIFPDPFKIAKVIPLYKKEERSKFDNYRPISLLSSLSKIFEKIVHKQLYAYMNDNKLLCLNQHGFRPRHSTETATLEFVDRILSLLDNDKVPFSIFIDLSKAFDTLNHNILLSKLSYYGIKHTPLKWFQSYLYNRRQYVDYCGSSSSYVSTSIGVPQGSILGPLLFLIYINDINGVSPFFQAILYADDTTLTSTLCCFHDNLTHLNTSDIINKELDKFYTWLCCNKLSLNINKTTYMLFHACQKRVIPADYPKIEINNIPLVRTNTFNFLGTIISDTLDWKPHINMVCKKLSRTIGILSKLRNTLPSRVLLTIYKSIFSSYLYQSILVWGHNQEKIFKLQKKAIRIVFKSKYNAHTDSLFKQHKLLKFTDMYNVSAAKFYHKYTNKTLPSFFDDMFSLLPVSHEHYTRYNQPRPQISKKKFTSKCIRYIIPHIIRNLPSCVTEKFTTHSLQGFSLYAKKMYYDKYASFCNIPNCYICGP